MSISICNRRNAARKENGMRAYKCNAMQRLQPLLLTNLRLLQVEGVSGIQQSGGRRAAGEVAVVRVLQLPAQPNKKNEKTTQQER
jgi:hypothetical protein